VVARKGGVGKSTFARAIAVSDQRQESRYH